MRWDGAPPAELRQAVETAIQRGAVIVGYLGSVQLRLTPDNRVDVVDARFSAFSDPWRGDFEEPESARRWLVDALGPEHVLGH